MIDGIQIIPLVRHLDERGYLLEVLRSDDKHFQRFGQVYITTCMPGIVKAWHAHKKQTDHFYAVKGTVKIGLYDGRETSPTYKQTASFILSELEPKLLIIPPLIWHGQMALGNEMSYLINVPTEPYNKEEPDELRADPFDNDFGFCWEPKSK